MTPAPGAIDGALVRWVVSALLVTAASFVPSFHGALARLADGSRAYAIGTVLLLVLIGVLPAVWPRTLRATPGRVAGILRASTVALGGLGLLLWVVWRQLPVVFAGPLEPERGDMLVIVEHAITRFLQGGHPYAVHKVPWDAPLSYGPTLWMPFIAPHALRADLRILTLAAQLVVPAYAMLAAAQRAGRGELMRAGVLVSLGAALVLNPDIARFYPIGHTQVYWPLMLVFCGLLARARWTAAAICLGLLVAARTTMVSLVPVFLLFLAANRLLRPRHVMAVGLAAGLPFLPFFVAGARTVWYAMFGVYLKVMKEQVWQSTSWAVETYGITGRLLESGLERYVEIVQVIALAITYLLAWRSMRRGTRLEPWLAIALTVFSMTTLWSVLYLYFDVWVLLVCALVAHDSLGSTAGRPVRTTAWIGMLTLVLVLAAAAVRPGSTYLLDVGDEAVAGYTGGGFGRDEAVVDEGRTVVWIEGDRARVRLPRAGWRGAVIRVALKPHASEASRVQRVRAALNGRSLGIAGLNDGWQEVTFGASSRDWRYGFNVLDLYFSYAVAADEPDSRALSAAIDWIRVE